VKEKATKRKQSSSMASLLHLLSLRDFFLSKHVYAWPAGGKKRGERESRARAWSVVAVSWLLAVGGFRASGQPGVKMWHFILFFAL